MASSRIPPKRSTPARSTRKKRLDAPLPMVAKPTPTPPLIAGTFRSTLRWQRLATFEAVTDLSARRARNDFAAEVRELIGRALKQVPSFSPCAEQMAGLGEFLRGLASGDFDRATQLWNDVFSKIVLQRIGARDPRLFQAADCIATDYYYRFFEKASLSKIDLSTRLRSHFTPLVYFGDNYQTLPPESVKALIPFPIISVPVGGQTNVYNWILMAHEIGHDLYGNIEGFESELQRRVEERLMGRRSHLYQAGRMPRRELPLNTRKFHAEQWRQWLPEVMGDIFGVLLGGPAFAFAIHETLGHSNQGFIEAGNQFAPHPPSYLRHLICLRTLRVLGFDSYVDLLFERLNQSNPKVDKIRWFSDEDGSELMFQPIREVNGVMKDVIDTCLHGLESLSGKSLLDIIPFTFADQRLVEKSALILGNGQKKSGFPKGAEPRHLVAAARIAFERNPQPHIAHFLHERLVHAILENPAAMANGICRRLPSQ